MSTEAPTARTLAPGAEVAGFRVERLIGRGMLGVVYEATQPALDRRVALKLIARDRVPAEQIRRLRWPEHPHAVSMYAAGECELGAFVAMRLLPGPTLADLLSERRLEPAAAIKALTDVAGVLDAAHAAGIVHGSLAAHNVLLDSRGRALLSDFGLGAADATVQRDRLAFAALVRECLGDDAPTLVARVPESVTAVIGAPAGRLGASSTTAPRRRRHGLGLTGLVVLAGAVGLVAAPTGTQRRPTMVLPPVLEGAQALGSELPAARVASVDCEGGRTGAGSACTIVQTKLQGHPLAAGRSGAVQRWAVRGAVGEFALQIVRRRGDQFAAVVRGPYEHVSNTGVHVFRTDLPVRAGDRIGLDVRPGGAIGMRKAVSGATTARWLGPLTLVPRTVDRGPGTGLDRELLLRVEYVPGARSSLAGQLAGRRAQLAPPGRLLAAHPIELPGGGVGRVGVVRVGRRIAIDLFKGGVRRARSPVNYADASGRLVSFAVFSSRVPQLVWRNADGRVVHHDYEVGARRVLPLDRPPV